MQNRRKDLFGGKKKDLFGWRRGLFDPLQKEREEKSDTTKKRSKVCKREEIAEGS